MTNYEWLISRLDAFIRKYYANQVIKGSLIFLSSLLFYILTVTVGEYYLYMPAWLKIILVSFFVLAGISALVALVIIPLAKMMKLGRALTYEQAAAIVGRHFSEISDKLLNILQLKHQNYDTESRALIEASIEQKSKQLSVVPITNAVDFSKNKKYLSFLLPLLLVGLFILVAAPNVFRDASARLLQPARTFERPAPFSFIIRSQPLQALRNSDFTLKVTTEGKALPADMSVETDGERIPMSPDGHIFQYTFKNITDPVNFRLYAAGYYSDVYTLTVVQKPILKAFKININYPQYIGKKDEVRNSLGDMTLPVGTKVSWAFIAQYTDEATLKLGNGTPVPLIKNASMFGYQYRFMNDTAYTISLSNRQSSYIDSYRYQVQVIPDQYPVVQVQQFADSVSGTQVLLNGTAGDDYGISKVLFRYQVTDDNDKEVAAKSVLLKGAGGALTSFQYYFDIDALNLAPGQKLTYFIEAWDNDGVHGPKASRSEMMTFRMYDKKQIDSAINANAQNINSGINNSTQKTQSLESDYKDMQTKMLDNTQLDWQQQQTLKEMAAQQQQLQNQLENIKKRFDEQKKETEQKNFSQDLKDKQADMEKQLDNLMNNELKEEMKKLQELMQQLNKDNAFHTMQQLQQDNKLFSMDMQRMQELMKKLEMQMRMEDMANKLDDLAKKQTDLKSHTDEQKKDDASLAKEQDNLKKELEKITGQDMKEMQQLNQQMQQQQSLQSEQQQGQQAQQNMQQSEQQLNKSQNGKASQSQSQAAQNIQSMAQSLRQKAEGMDAQQLDMDISAVRQILTNLMRLSFDQEDLMNQVANTSASSQSYVANQEEQNRLHRNSLMIRDSLFSLSKRLAKISVTVNKETTELEHNMQSAVDLLEDRRTGEAEAQQQYVMTHTNNLALMLNEMLANLLQMQSQAMKQGSCNKPGGMTPKPGKGNKQGAGQQLSDIITQQQQLGNAMQQMQNAMQQRQGQKPGDNNPNGQSKQGGQSGSSGMAGESEQLARLAEEQASIRRQLQELNSLLNSKGLGTGKDIQDAMQKMDRTETDIVNRRITNEMLARQKEILTRLLESEKALREQEQDDKRESKTAKDITRPMPPELQKYLRQPQQLIEMYKTAPPQLKPYFRKMVEQYYQALGKK